MRRPPWLSWAVVPVCAALVAGASPPRPAGAAAAVAGASSTSASASSASSTSGSGLAAGGLLFGPTDISGEPGPQSEVSVAVDPLNPQIIVAGANDLAGSGEAAWATADGGATWRRVEMPLQDRSSTEQAFSATDPAVAAGPTGIFYFSYTVVSQNGNAASVVVSASTDGGRRWSVPAVVSAGLTHRLDNDKDMLAVDDWTDPHRGYLYDVWDQNEPAGKNPTQEVLLSYAPPGGVHWSKPVVLNLGYGSGEGIYAVDTVAPDGSVFVVWDDYGQSNEQSVLLGRRCGWTGNRFACGPAVVVGRSFVNLNGPGPIRGQKVDCESEQFGVGPSTPANEGWSCYAIPPQPARGIAAAPSVCAGPDGQLNVVYDTATSPGAPNTEVDYTSSVDNGATWSTPIEIDGDRTSAYDFFPWIACDPVTGALAAAFYSTRGDPSGQRVQEELTWSLDRGAAWTAPQQISRTVSNEAVPGADNNNYGDYEGLALLRDVAYPAWTGYGGSSSLREQVMAAAAPLPLPPPAPTGLTVTPASAAAQTLRWQPTPGATSYSVYALPAASASPTAAAPVLLASHLSVPGFTRQDVSPEGGPALVVRAVDPAGSGPPSAALVVPVPAVPGAPGAVRAAPSGSSAVVLSWSAADQAASYTIFVNGRRWRADVRGPSASVTGLRPNRTYTFTVRGVNVLGAGPAGPTARAATAPAPPAGLRVRVVSGRVTLTWSPSPGADAYLVRRSLIGRFGPFHTLARVTVPGFVDGSVGSGRDAWYTVSAVAAASGVGAQAPPVGVHVPIPPPHPATSGTTGPSRS